MNKRIPRWTPAAILLIAGTSNALAAGPFGASLELSSLNGTSGFVINGVDALDSSGWSVSSAGDINGDGIDDLIIGFREGIPTEQSLDSESYVVFGAAGVGSSGTLELSSLNGTNGFVCNGIDDGDRSGLSVSSAGDVNDDGIDDLIIGAPSADPNGQVDAGESYVVFGAAGVGSGGTLELSSLNGTNGFVCNGIDADDRCGTTVSSAGDVNDDGIGDLIIGAVNAAPNGQVDAGETYVVFGAAGIGSSGTLELSSLNGTNGFVCNGIDADDRCGWSVSSAGDINGDGIDDLIIGAPSGDLFSDGASYVVFGAAGVGSSGTLELSSLNGTNGFVCNGIDAGDLCGRSVSGAGDVNGDGIGDLIIGATHAGPSFQAPSFGESYVIFGAVGVGSGGTLELSSLNGTNGFVCNGIDAGDNNGRSVSGAGDVNGDGISDLIIGATHAGSSFQLPSFGESYVVFGAVGVGSSGALDLSLLNGTNGFILNGLDGRDYNGRSVSGAGDVNGDGIDDFIIGAYGADPNGQSFAGESYVVFGAAGVGSGGTLDLSSLNGTNGFVCNGIDENDGSGFSVSSADDVNGDGIDDIIIAAVGADPNGFFSGETYVIFGRTPCPADINDDGVVDTADLGALVAQFGTPGPGADINYDGVVDTADLGILIAAFGTTTCP